MKCEICKINKGVLWFSLMVVCQKCYSNLMDQKKQKEAGNEKPHP